MRIELDKILKREAESMVTDADFSYNNNENELNTEDAHMIGQKTLMRLDLLEVILNNISYEEDIQRSTINLSKKLFNQIKNDIDYMYPNNNYEEANAHVVMQLIKRTSEDLTNFLDFFTQKHDLEVKLDIVQILKAQFQEMNNDIDYAYPDTHYDDDNAHIVLQGLLGKSSSLFDLLNDMTPKSEEEKEFKQVYLEKMSGLISLLNNGYNSSGYYQQNGHEIFSELIEGLQVEIKDLNNINIREDNFNDIKETNIVKDSYQDSIKSEKKVSIKNPEEEINNDEMPRVRSEEVKTKIKGML